MWNINYAAISWPTQYSVVPFLFRSGGPWVECFPVGGKTRVLLELEKGDYTHVRLYSYLILRVLANI